MAGTSYEPDRGTRLDVYRLGRDERFEIGQMLSRLPRRERVAFLHWCCAAATRYSGLAVKVTQSSGEARDVWSDLVMLFVCHNFPVGIAWTELVERCRRCNVRG